MKYLKLILPILLSSLVILLCFSCDPEINPNPEEKEFIIPVPDIRCIVDKKGNCPQGCEECLVRNNVIIRYSKNVDSITRDKVRKNNGVTKYENCSCGDDRLERWIFNLEEGKTIDIEKLITVIENDTGEGGVNGDHDFTVIASSENEVIKPRYRPNDNQIEINKAMVSNNTNAINIAVIDTGLDVGYFDFGASTNVYLYDTSFLSCSNVRTLTSGWNFVDNNNNIKEDSNNDNIGSGHGTFVTKVITKTIAKTQVSQEVRILPIKAFNDEGKGTYWNVLCALNYANSFEDLHLINTSFGFHNFNNPMLKDITLFGNFVNEMEKKSLIVASSGNSGVNTDIIDNYHYLSGLNHSASSSIFEDNVISVGGYEGNPIFNNNNTIDGITMSPESNFGEVTVDIAAPFNLKLELLDGSLTELQGTSYAAPFVTGKLTEFIKGPINSPITSKKTLLDKAPTSGLLINQTRDSKVIAPKNQPL